MKVRRRRGGIATLFATMIGIGLISFCFFQYMSLHITSMKYENMSQYARDSLLILETHGQIEKSYLLDVKNDLSGKLNMKNGETLNIFLQVGNGPEYNISNSSTPSIINSDFGDKINLKFSYNYNVRDLSFKNSILPTITDTKEDMVVELSTISKNRRTSDG